MQIQKISIIAWILASYLLFPSPPAFAKTLEDMRPGQIKKLDRGFKNTFGGWLEIPSEINNFSEQRDWFEAMTTGVAVGVGRALARTGIGVAEVLSFPYETTERNEPLILPALPSQL